MTKQQRKVVFFLGAGASFGAGAVATVQHGGKVDIPVQSRFWETFLRLCRSPKNRLQIESFLFRYFKGYDRVPTRLKPQKRRMALRDVDVEEAFTFLSERDRAPSTSNQLKTVVRKVWGEMISELPNVFSRFEANKKTRATYRSLLKNLARTRDTFVSFNYDTIFEKSLPQGRPWHYVGLTEKAKSIRVLKPHGSINWEGLDSRKVKVRNCPRQALVVAPTHLKFIQGENGDSKDSQGYLDQSPTVSAIWKKMEDEMRKAKALVFIGYSFPVADLYFSSVLRSVFADRARAPMVVLVNPDATALRNRLSTRFSLIPDNIRVFFDIQTFVQVERDDLLKALTKP